MPAGGGAEPAPPAGTAGSSGHNDPIVPASPPSPSSVPASRRRRVIALWVATVVVALAGLFTLPVKGEFPVDLQVYRWGGQQLLEGEYLYADREGLPFTYPPFAALLFTPMALLTREAALAVLFLGSALGLVVMLRRALEGAREGSMSVLGHRVGPTVLVLTGLGLLALPLEPVWQTFGFGQVNLLLGGLLAADLLRRGDRPWRGVWLGVAAGIKLTPLFLLAWLVVTRQWRAAWVSVASMLATIAIGFAVLPRTSWDFWTQVLPETGRIGAPSYVANQSVKGLLARFLGDESPALDPAWFVGALLVGVVLVLAGGRLAALGDRSAGLWLACLGMLMASPVSWSHHWVWIAPLVLALLLSAARRDVPYLAWVGVGAMTVAAALQVIWTVPFRDGREMEWNAWQMVLGNSYVLAGLVVAVAAVPLAVRQGRDLLAGRGGVTT